MLSISFLYLGTGSERLVQRRVARRAQSERTCDVTVRLEQGKVSVLVNRASDLLAKLLAARNCASVSIASNKCALLDELGYCTEVQRFLA